MEKLCEHCGHVFMAKRNDSLYCSASCRQMAYMERRLNPLISYPSIDGYSNSGDPSIDGYGEPEETSIDTLKLSDDLSIDISAKKQEPLVDDRGHQEKLALQKSNQEAYQPAESLFLNSIVEMVNTRDYLSALAICLYPPNIPVEKTGIRLKCLAECLLMFSEAKCTELDDLKEVCNAFTLTMQSKYYKQLPANFPYTRYILRLRDRLRRFIISHEPSKSVRFRLSPESRTELISTRYELSEFFPNTPFCNLSFSE